MPWLNELFRPNSLDLLERRPSKTTADLEIAVLQLPSISNFSDLDPLEAEPSVRLRWLTPDDSLGEPDAVILPGSKQTLRDLRALQSSGMSQQLQATPSAMDRCWASAAACRCGQDLRSRGAGGGRCTAGSGLGLLPINHIQPYKNPRNKTSWRLAPTLPLEGI